MYNIIYDRRLYTTMLYYYCTRLTYNVLPLPMNIVLHFVSDKEKMTRVLRCVYL